MVYLQPEPGEASWPPVWTTAGTNQGHPDFLQARDGKMSYRPEPFKAARPWSLEVIRLKVLLGFVSVCHGCCNWLECLQG